MTISKLSKVFDICGNIVLTEMVTDNYIIYLRTIGDVGKLSAFF